MISGKRILFAAAAALATTGPVLAQDTLKIGHISVSSGFLKSVGEPSNVAVDIAVQEINEAGGINGKPIELFRYDTGSDPKQAAVAARTLAKDDEVLAIVGPFSSGEANVALNDAERLKVLMLPTSSSAPGLTDGKTYGWRLTEDEKKQFGRLLAAMKEKGLPMETAEIVYVSDEVVANGAGTKLYPALLAEAGVEVGDPIPVQWKTFDMSAQVAKIVQSNPDFVAVAALPEHASKLIAELNRQGYEGRVIGSQIFADPNVLELFGPEGEGTLLVAGFWKGRTEASQKFNDAFVAEAEARGIHKLGAHHSDAQAYDTVYLVKQLMEAAGTTGDPDKLEEERQALVDGMEGIRFSGILADDICFDGHDAELPGYVIEIKDGEWTKFAEAPADSCE
ncbi:branched-chain amino acid ABC transporter, periplasmic aminoacid-binding protein, putative [Pseudooceanicola batsensis HTCC2597]|uniref:Branched-chain amino acid ABC transporter, periplasmic aminoacid-binding protein, putative n=1 Tax=Pseudooceanicola batsensis (strain ATCC BAA-863 / DSM 15984 / KCTC 12145 / HTCC2597) TaxID=252305 RepID=A3U0C5_PSEBH|nr:ABC transporter substrate-binding protein [Pseudooceanicola batsensis]EAQ02216.1 branched-chain amino acid ABC transporter, periplasmic aminoacid-binding protein, putative [Pseudooceanicola batsensis HTCC2597]